MSRKLALLLSNDSYKDPKLLPLYAPASDVDALGDVLNNPQYGSFDEVNVRHNLSASEMLMEIAQFFANTRRNDLALLYFSGHGLRDQSGRLLLAATDTDSVLPRANSIHASFLAEEMDECSAQHIVLILDCCHSGAFQGRITKGAISSNVEIDEIFKGQKRGQGRVVLSASNAAEFAYEVGNRSVFTHFLVQGVKSSEADLDRDGYIDIDELYKYVYEKVAQHSPSQTPNKSNYAQQGKFLLFYSSYPRRSTASIDETHPQTAQTKGINRVVDKMFQGDYTTINSAIRASKSGDTILIRPGIYEESIIFNKPVELIGDGGPNEVVIQVVGKKVLLFSSSTGKIRKLTLRQNGGEYYGIDITQGNLTIEDCDISSQGLACIAIHDGANPIIRNNRIYDGNSAGIIIYNNGQGLIDSNEIYANKFSGIDVARGSNPTLRANKIYGGKSVGIYIHDQGQALIEGNEIYENIYSGIRVVEGSQVKVYKNRINRNGAYAVEVDAESGGIYEDNDLRNNKLGAWNIESDSKRRIIRNRNL